MIEKFWPVGEPAANLRALLIGRIVGQRISYDEKTQRDIEVIIEMLDGKFEPPKPVAEMTEDEKKEQAQKTKQRLKAMFGI